MGTAIEASDIVSVGTDFVTALAARDWTGLEACLDQGVHFRALIPPGLREAEDTASATRYFRQWFGAADPFELVTFDVRPIGDRLGISYYLRLHQDRWYVAEQRAYCEVTEGRITRMNLLCSGFRPEGTDREHSSL